MRNEARHVANFIADIAAQDYDGPMELFVADGRSSDDSRVLILEAAARAGVAVNVLENPDGHVSPGLNRCIEASDGDLVVRLDVHSRYAPDYVRRLVDLSNVTGAANVGGIWVPEGITPTERAVAAAMDSPFGGVGWTREGEGWVETDTVPFGAFRRDVLEAVGGFDEDLVRNQDDELNLRLRLAGERVILDRGIRIGYIPRGRMRDVFRQYYQYGRWKIPVMRRHNRVLGLRSLVPALFLLWVVALALAAPWLMLARVALAATLALYLGAALVFGVRALRRRGERLSLLPRVMASYLAFHVGYGAGMIRGLLPGTA